MQEPVNTRVLAAPSWVFPGGIEENCTFLAGKVQELGLLFMESAPALAYGPKDLPPDLAALPLSWHVHLPGDLDWSDPQKAAGACLALMDKVDFLGARRAVLHPPHPDKTADKICLPELREFVLYWQQSRRDPWDLLLENRPGDDPETLLAASLDSGTAICLDLAHLLLSGRTAADLSDAFMRRVRLLHLCAPGTDGGHHRPLGELDAAGAASGRDICRRAVPGTVFMLELFSWQFCLESIPVLDAWMEL